MRIYVNPHPLRPPKDYIMPNVTQRWDWKRWLDRGWSRHVIVDSGVARIFKHRRNVDYPRPYWELFSREVEMARGDRRVWVVIPDYPDDYEEGMTYERGMDNVEKTFRNIERWIHVRGVLWLPVVQARYLDGGSFIDACRRMRREHRPERVGVGTVCKTNDLAFIEFCLRTCRRYFPDAWIHAFGLTLKALPFARLYVDSLDSASYVYWMWWESRDRGWDYHDPRRSDKAFAAWMGRAREILGVSRAP